MAKTKAAKPQKAFTVGQLIQALEARAPSGTSEAWDNTGLIVGDPEWKTPGAIVSVDLTEEAIEAARKSGARLIVNHHPCIFPKSRGLSRVISGAGGTSQLVFEALREGIAVAAYHTNFDRCALEVVETISQGLGADARGRLFDSGSGDLVKLVVFVPEKNADELRVALCGAGAGQIGNYDSCTFNVSGEGTFRGGEGTEPHLGKPGRLERVREVRVETIVPQGLKPQVLQAMRAAHPYEEIAYDLYPVLQTASPGAVVRGVGYGFWGDLRQPKSFSDVAESVTRLFDIRGYLLTGSRSIQKKKIGRVAFAAGKGASFVESAAAQGCDLLITGEAGYHTALDGSRRGVAIMELGHRESEKFFAPTVKSWLQAAGLGQVEALDVLTQGFYSEE